MVIRFVIVMGMYALAMLFLGWLTFHVAPPGARAITSLAVCGGIGAAALVCAVLTAMAAQKPRLGLIGVYLGFAVAAAGIAGPAMRLGPSLEKTREFNEILERDGSLIVSKGGDQAKRNTAYQAVGLGAASALSAVALASLVAVRPRVPQRAIDSSSTPPAPASGGSA